MSSEGKGQAFGAAFVGVLALMGAATALHERETGRAKISAQEPSVEVAAAPVQLDALLASERRVAVERLTGRPWQLACLSRGAQPAPAPMAACWPGETDRALGGSFLNVVAEDGTCHQWRTVMRVIDRRFRDAVCLPKAEVPNLALSLRGKVIDIE